jgi:VWFA-related protein
MQFGHLAILAALVFAAQNETIRVTTKLIQISVVVRDKAGPIAGLAKDDFTVTDNGKSQRIEVFAASDNRNQKQPSVGKIAAGIASNLMNAAGEVPRSATGILLDLINTANEGRSTEAVPLGNATSALTAISDEKEAIKQLIAYLRTVRQGDRVALFVLGSQLQVIQDFTGDPDVLVRAAQRLRGLDQAGIEVSTHEQLAALLDPDLGGDADPTSVGIRFATAISSASTINRAVASADAFEAIARHMSGLPGRKNLIWLSAGFPFRPPTAPRRPNDARVTPGGIETPDDFSSQLTRASRALNDANVSIYPVDYQGLNGAYPEVMMRLASATGGNVTYHTNDLKEAVATAVADGDVSYTLGFYSNDERYDGKLHDLKVNVTRKDVQLHYQSGYYATAKAMPEKQRKDIFAELLGSVTSSSQIGLVAAAEPDPAKPGSYNVTISIDAKHLDLSQKDDHRVGQLTLGMRLQSSKSKTVQSGAIPLNFTEAQFLNVLRQGFVVRESVQAGSNDRLRIVVQDQTTGLAGALWLPLKSR